MTPSAAAGDRAGSRWHLGRRTIEISKPVLLGIVNITPDSFSDGGVSYSLHSGIARALEVLEQGADVVDIGGESTRPGAAPVSEGEELRRVIPVIEGVLAAKPDAVISVDTVKSGVARHALDSGAAIVNDVSGFRLDDRIAGVCAAAKCGVILMHSRGNVAEMASYAQASYGSDVTDDVIRELGASVERAIEAGVERSSIVVDPGFGFSKTTEHSMTVLRELDRVCGMGFPVMVGVSRKRMIGELTGVLRAEDRDAGSVGVAVMAMVRGARVFRVHDVRGHRQALDAAFGVLGSQ